MIVTREAGQASRPRHQGRDGRRPGLRQRRLGLGGSASHRLGAKIVAVTDWKGGVYNANGLDIAKMIDYAKQHKTIDGFPGGEPIDNEQLFALDVDVLVPAALENQITMENAPLDQGARSSPKGPTVRPPRKRTSTCTSAAFSSSPTSSRTPAA